MSERPEARRRIDAMTRNLMATDPELARNPARARRIARDAARRTHHGESIHTEGKPPRP